MKIKKTINNDNIFNNREEKCDVTLPWKQNFWQQKGAQAMTAATPTRTGKRKSFILAK